MKETAETVDQTARTKRKQLFYFKLIKYSLKNDIVAGIFIFGWICTLLSVEILSFQFGSLTASFYNVLPSRNSGHLTEIVIRFCTFLVMMAVGKGSLMATRGLLSRAMRRNLTEFLHSRYVCLKGLKAVQKEIETLDFPDQRITEDVEKFTIGLLEIVEIIFLTPILISFYTVQVSYKLSLLSILGIYSHFSFSLFVLRFGLRALKDLTGEKEKREANFRNEHVSIRNTMESFIFVNSNEILNNLKINLNFQLKKLLFTSKKLLITESVYEMIKSFFSYSGALLNFLLLAGELSFGLWRNERDPARIAQLISMTSFLSLYLIFQLSKLASVIDMIGSLNGQVTRLSQLLEVVEVVVEEEGDDDVEEEYYDDVSIDVNVDVDNPNEAEPPTILEFNNFTGRIKDKILYEKLNFKIKTGKGENILICGSNGKGKTSILRFITGLWPSNRSNCLKIYSKNFMSCPQNFILFTGSLNDLLGITKEENDQIVIDEESRLESFDKKVIQVLEIVGLNNNNSISNSNNNNINHLEPFDQIRSIESWQSILTPGQHQRLSLARVLIHQPQLVILDETFLAMGKQEIETILKEFEKKKMSILVLDPTGDFNKDFFKQTINI